MTNRASSYCWLSASLLAMVALASVFLAGPRDATSAELSGTPRPAMVVAFAAAGALIAWLFFDLRRKPRDRATDLQDDAEPG